MKIESHTRPVGQINEYDRFLVGTSGQSTEWLILELENSSVDAGKVRLKFSGIGNRESAERLIGKELGISDNQLEPLQQGEYYWKDLVGLTVTDTRQRVLGKVIRMLETGANDVVVVATGENGDQEEVLVPWIAGVVDKVDLVNGFLRIDWDWEE